MKVIRTIILILNILVALALPLTTLAGSIAPSSSVLPSLLAFGFLPLLAINLLFVIFWLLRRRWGFLISVAAIALRWGFIGLFFQIGGTSRIPSPTEHPSAVSIMTYNVHLFGGSETDHLAATDSHAQNFIALVRKHSPDILCLQECATTRTVSITDSLELLGYNHYYGTHTTSSGAPYGTVVFSRHPITFVRRLDHEKLLVELLCEKQRMRVFCLHMNSYRFEPSDLQGIDRARHGKFDTKLRATLTKVRSTILTHEREWTNTISPVVSSSSVPIVVAGDLNDIASSWLYARLADGLTDAFREQGNGMSITYSGFPAFRIDAIFHSSELRTLSYRRLRSDISDHYPVLATLEFIQ